MFEEIDRKFAVRTKRADKDDAKIRELFGQWIEAERFASTDEDIKDEERCERCAAADDLVLEIAETPAAGSPGLAIKVYLAAHRHFNGRPGDGAALDDVVIDELSEVFLGGAIADAVRCAPELQPLAERFLASWRESLRGWQ